MRSVVVAAPLVLSGCLLTQSLSGLSDGPAADAVDASAVDASAGDALVQADSEGGLPTANDAGVPIEFVQTNAALGAASNTTPVTVPFNATVRPHSAIVVALAYRPPPATLLAITDSLGNAYKVVSGPWDGGNNVRHYIAVALDTPPGADAVSVTLSASTAELGVYIHEYAGIALASAFDQASSGNGTTTALDGMTTPIVTTSAARELVFGFGQASIVDPGTGFTARSRFSDNVTEDRIVDAVGTYQATATMKTGVEWAMMVATFKGR